MYPIGTKIDDVRLDGHLDRLRRDLDVFAGLAIDAVEIPVHGLDAIVHGRLRRDRMGDARAILKSYGFSYSVHAPNTLDLMNRDAFPLHLDVFRASLEFAAGIGSSILVYHAGRFVPEEEFGFTPAPRRKNELSERLDQELEALRDLASGFPSICIGIEIARPYLTYSPYCYAEDPDMLRRHVLAIDRPNVRITLDTGHLYLASRFYGFDPVGAVVGMAPLIAHAHVHDNFGIATHPTEKQQTYLVPFGRGDSHLPVGWGEIPLGEILRPLVSSFRGMLITELRGRYFEHTEESIANLRRILDKLTGEDHGQNKDPICPQRSGWKGKGACDHCSPDDPDGKRPVPPDAIDILADSV